VNILDENIPQDQRRLLQGWRIPARQIGHDVGQKGMKDNRIIPFLHQQSQPAFFTRDQGFYDRSLCHASYCLVYLAVEKSEVAIFVRRLLHHPAFDTKAKRMGAVIRVSHAGLSVWRLNVEKEMRLAWNE
jgi:hypothetical protein